MVYLQTGQPQQALAALDALPPQQPTVRSDLELQLLRAEAGLRQQLDETPRLVREVLDVAARHGFVQTILDTAPQLLQHVISDSDLYPRSEHFAALVAAGVDARQRTPRRPQEGPLVDPLTEADTLYQSSSDIVYGAAHHAFTFLVRRYGETAVRDVLHAMSRGPDFSQAFTEAVGIPPEVFLQDFRRYVQWRGFKGGRQLKPQRPRSPAPTPPPPATPSEFPSSTP